MLVCPSSRHWSRGLEASPVFHALQPLPLLDGLRFHLSCVPAKTEWHLCCPPLWYILRGTGVILEPGSPVCPPCLAANGVFSFPGFTRFLLAQEPTRKEPGDSLWSCLCKSQRKCGGWWACAQQKLGGLLSCGHQGTGTPRGAGVVLGIL